MPDQDALPHTLFQTRRAEGEERFEEWRRSISVVFDVAPVARQDLSDFSATVDGTHLGSLIIGNIDFGAQQFSRSRPRVARDSLDHYLVQWYRSGGFVGQADGREIEVQAGDIVVFDLTRTLHTWARPSGVMSLLLPRELLDQTIPGATDLHGSVLPAGNVFADLLADHLHSLHRRLPGVPLSHAPAVAQATTQMIAACVRPGTRTLAEARAGLQGVTLERLQQYIGRHLGTELSPASLAQAFGISRTLLYELFEPLGGVAKYIQQRRLQRAFLALTNPANRRLRIAEIALRVGFSSESHFSRAFRAAFGATPTDVRAVSLAAHDLRHGHPMPTESSAEYAEWVRGLQAA